MKNKIKLFGIIVLAAVIGFSMTACGEEEEKGGGIKFDSALYGTWQKDNDNSRLIIFFTDSYGDCFNYGSSERTLTAKNGNTYTFGDFFVFTAVVGSDGKLTISGFTGTNFPGSYYNGTYTK
jgi:hypothetical protein